MEGPGLWLADSINAHSSGAGPNKLWQGQLAPRLPRPPAPHRTRPISCTVPQSTTGTLPKPFPLLNTSVTASWQGQRAKVNICLEYVLQASHLHMEAGGAQLHLSFSVPPAQEAASQLPLSSTRGATEES